MEKKLLRLGISSAVLAAVLTGCGNSGSADSATSSAATSAPSETSATQEASSSTDTELTVMVTNDWIDPATPAGEAMAEAIELFESQNPGVTVTLQGAASTDIKESFQTAALAGGGADIITTDNSGHAIDLAAMGLLVPLENFTTDEELIQKYQPGPLDSGKFQGKYYSLPWYMNCCGMYYNADRLDELGIAVPTDWQSLQDALKQVKDAGYGGIITYQSAYAFYAFFYQNGCKVIDTSGEKPAVTVNDAAGTEAWNYICSLIENDYLVESFKEATSWDKAYESFGNGDATFLFGGDWCASGIQKANPDLNFGIACMPQGKEQATVLGGWTWNINANSKHPEIAYDFITFMCSEQADPVLAPGGRHSARLDWDIQKALEGNETLLPLAEQFSYTMARPAIINEKAIDKIIVNALLEVEYGQQTPDEALAELTQNLQDNIDSNYN